MANLPNIEYSKKKTNPTIDSDTCNFLLPFYKDDEYFSSLENFVQFIKEVEKMVRKNPRYKRYIAYLKNDIGLNSCQVFGNIQPEDDDNTVVEMHHGPIFTLFDLAAIIVDHWLAKGKKITTFNVANQLLIEHELNNVQVVFLSETAHEKIHDKSDSSKMLFINMKQSFGDLNTFINKYNRGLLDERIEKMNSYIKMSEKYDSFDNDVFKLQETLKKWS